MFRKMRRSDRLMAEIDTAVLLDNVQYGVLSTVGKDSNPNGVPISFVYMNNAIYLHCATEGEKLDNIITNNRVCFTVVDAVEVLPAAFSTKYKSAVVFGEAAVVENPEEKRSALTGFIKKYSPEFYEAGLQYIDNAFEKTKVLKIVVRNMTGKARS
ncbi:pyridoxamine 5'-phosphate oxidase family protein [Anaerospora sp.]|uniref:pyridoxamine 5'-phosphate oxidase family protein n=1 Tax=Anaerospora sp. TaxID=1960278 RepID=UPI00289EC13D|nr:pyridoxamine 5'-phosphate oxidase family protein [Anaerospora sp.]